MCLVFALSWYLAFAGALRRHQEQQLADSEGRLRTLSTQLMTAHEDERRTLSRDLHDELGQLVTSVALDLQRASPADNLEKKDQLIRRALHGTELLLHSIHEISARIRPTILDDLGLKDAVQNLLGLYERHTGIVPRVELRFEQEVPATVSENVYRILQEALNNVSKHAHTQEVHVEIRVAGGQVFLGVRDRGAGFVPGPLPGRGLGILGMRERAELLNGTFAVKSAPGMGTQIEVTIPIPHPEDKPAFTPRSAAEITGVAP
jgi:signal transduction histidine kinase